MTKEELAQKIAQGEYTDCQMDGKYSVSFKIGDARITATKIGKTIVAMTVISTDISEEEYNKILKISLRNELANVEKKHSELLDTINKL